MIKCVAKAIALTNNVAFTGNCETFNVRYFSLPFSTLELVVWEGMRRSNMSQRINLNRNYTIVLAWLRFSLRPVTILIEMLRSMLEYITNTVELLLYFYRRFLLINKEKSSLVWNVRPLLSLRHGGNCSWGGGEFPILSPRNVSSVQTYVQNLIRFRRK